MKKVLAILLSSALVLSLAACGEKTDSTTSSTEPAVSTSTEVSTEASVDEPVASTETSTEASVDEPTTEENDVVSAISYADYAAAELGTDVVVEFTVQATQSWWNDQITVYGADKDGAYFVYNMACSQDDAAKLVPGAVIKVAGTKTAWAGEVEIGANDMGDAPSFEFVDEAGYIAPAKDATDLLGKDEIADLQNQLVSFTDMTVTAVSYKNNQPGDDIYVNLSKDDTEYYFCLEYYLNGSDEEFYNLVGNLEVGTVVDVEAYLYWYEGINPHITKVTVK